jgi:asparagine synthase (glutamine-hydrolysing)
MLSMKHRGPDQSEQFESGRLVFGHNRLAVIDVENGVQPMSAVFRGKKYTIVYNGEIYNAPELTRRLQEQGVTFQTKCDTEVVLYSYIVWGERCPEELNGIFAFAVCDEEEETLFLARDRFGVKPLYYAYEEDTFLFASEIKARLRYEGVSPKVDRCGLWQLLFLTPVTLRGVSGFRDIESLKAGECAVADRSGLHKKTYWRLRAEPFAETAEAAVEHTRELLQDAIRRQMVSDVPLCTFLSGGLDSSVVSAVAAEYYRKTGGTLSTYSFEYEDNEKSFHNSLFQPESDDAYAVFAAEALGTDHTVLTASQAAVADALREAALARDFPGQADIDSSLLYYCRQVKRRHTVALSGECADEIFGGVSLVYPSGDAAA